LDTEVTHETYATIASLYSTAGGYFDSSLLSDYGRYLSLFETFDRCFELNAVPHVGALCIDAAARAAMQTNIIYGLIEADCSEWARIAWSERSRPDARFSVFLKRENADRLRSTVAQAMEAGPGTLRRIVVERISGNEALELVRCASVADQDKLSEIAFATATSILAENGFKTLGFDEQRASALQAIRKVEAYAGQRLKTHFHVPGDLQEDRDAIVSDFRREKLTINRNGQAAGFVECDVTDRFFQDSFVREGQGFHYFEICAMPKAKALAVYGPVFGSECLEPDTNLVFGLRRWIEGDEVWANGLVEIAVLKTSEELNKIRKAYPQHRVSEPIGFERVTGASSG
jgi:hypothetical protein